MKDFSLDQHDAALVVKESGELEILIPDIDEETECGEATLLVTGLAIALSKEPDAVWALANKHLEDNEDDLMHQ